MLRWMSEPPETRFRAKARVVSSKEGYLSVAEGDLVTVLQQVLFLGLVLPRYSTYCIRWVFGLKLDSNPSHTQSCFPKPHC